MLLVPMSLLTSCRERGSDETVPAAPPPGAAESVAPPHPAAEQSPAAMPAPGNAPVQGRGGRSSPAQTQGNVSPSVPGSPAVDLDALTQAVRRYGAEKRRVPSNLNEVVAAGYLKVLPPPPPGMRYVIDPTRLEVLLVKQ